MTKQTAKTKRILIIALAVFVMAGMSVVLFSNGSYAAAKKKPVDKALKELVDNGMIEIEPRFENNIQITSSYSLCHLSKWHTKKKIIYNIVADINGILEHNDKRGTKYLDGKLD